MNSIYRSEGTEVCRIGHHTHNERRLILLRSCRHHVICCRIETYLQSVKRRGYHLRCCSIHKMPHGYGYRLQRHRRTECKEGSSIIGIVHVHRRRAVSEHIRSHVLFVVVVAVKPAVRHTETGVSVEDYTAVEILCVRQIRHLTRTERAFLPIRKSAC